MKKTIIQTLVGLSIAGMMGTNIAAQQSPQVQKDIKAYQAHFKKSFSKVNDFTKGPYIFDADKRLQFEGIMEMPPFEESVEKGEEAWNTPFKNGKTYASCFTGPVEKIRTQFPRWNHQTNKVDTLEATINQCRTDNGEKKMGYKKGMIAFISAYLTTAAEGETINVIIPKGNTKALAAYNEGKKMYYSKRGQLNLSCADCHVYNASKRIRGDILSPGLGQLSHFPVWRGKWARNASNGNGFGTIQRRYGGCFDQVRAQPLKTQGREYSNLEYFHTAMSNGTPITGTEYRQ